MPERAGWSWDAPKPVVVIETVPEPRPLLYDAAGQPLAPPPKEPIGYRPPRPENEKERE